MVVLDDVGFADLGCYGSEIGTPSIDRVAADGLRYTNFHVTAMCSPTRASLLTGRNHHSVGMGVIAEWFSGYPGYTGRITKRAGTIAEMLRPHGFTTLAVGKWHVMPMSDATAVGPFDDWPLQRGFGRWYGFHGSLADQWHSELFEDNHAVETPRPGRHLSEDLVDRAIGLLRDHCVNAPERPFLLYLAFGAAHFPHQVPKEHVENYRGRFDAGWDRVRDERLGRQKALGIVPPDTRLAPRDPDVEAWASLADPQRRLYARLQEVYAAFLEHTDAQIGRLVSELERLGRRANTLLLVLSDNGASGEGGPHGAASIRKHLYYEPETLDDGLAALGDLGSENSFSHYPMGWAQASNTPLKWYKKDVHGGGVRAPLIVSWPARIAAGGIRRQYHHVTDIVPTILELLSIDAPVSIGGVPQMPIHGTSMAYTLVEAEAPTRRRRQYYELAGDRGLWQDGWKAVARHEAGTDFDRDRWELYHLDADFSECDDLAKQHPERLRQLIEQWWVEAGIYGVLPLDDREFGRTVGAPTIARRVFIFYPGTSRVDRLRAPDITDRSYRIHAELEVPPEGAEGVILALGTRFGGFTLYVHDGRVRYEYVYTRGVRQLVETPIDPGRHDVVLEFSRTGPRRGSASLSLDGRPKDRVDIPKTWPMVGISGGLTCGRDGGSAVSAAYQPPFEFTGTLERVVVELLEVGPTSTAERDRGLVRED